MAQLEDRYAQPGTVARRGAAVDAGLRAYMLRVYNYMAAGVALTGVVAYFTGTNSHVQPRGCAGAVSVAAEVGRYARSARRSCSSSRSGSIR